MAIRALSPSPVRRPLLASAGLAMRRTRLAIRDRRRRLAAGASRRAHADLRDRYLDLVELICDAAYAGVEPWMEEAYAERTRWLREHYGRIRPHAAAHVVPDDADRWDGRACDAFEMLFVPESLALLLERDGGTLIARLGRTQAALESWEASLSRQEVRL